MSEKSVDNRLSIPLFYCLHLRDNMVVETLIFTNAKRLYCIRKKTTSGSTESLRIGCLSAQINFRIFRRVFRYFTSTTNSQRPYRVSTEVTFWYSAEDGKSVHKCFQFRRIPRH
jgi:hypothetical protein